MNDQCSFNSIDSLLLQFALQTRELSQKKNEINEHIKVCRADIAERRSYIETLHRNMTKLEEEMRAKQSAVVHNKANAKSMKTTNSLLLQYEQTLKEELESRRASYNHDTETYEERIASYKKIYQSHKEYYCLNPLAQNLLMLQAEKEEVESRLKACDDLIIMKQKELDHLTAPAVSSTSPEKLPDSASATEPENQSNLQNEEDTDFSVDISSLHLSQTKDGHNTSLDAHAEEICEENELQDPSTACSPSQEVAANELWACQQLDEQTWPDVMPTDDQDQGSGPEDQVSDHQSTLSDIEEAVEEEEMEETVAMEEEPVTSGEANGGLAAFLQSLSESSTSTVKTVPSTPTFPFNFSPGGSPHHGTSDTKSPAFDFSFKSDPSTPVFTGFKFDEDPSFTFTGSFFDEKKTTESKSSTCPDFLFGQPEPSEDFQLPFTSKGPKTTNKDNTKDDFPFSFNF